MFIKIVIKLKPCCKIAKSAGAVEYTDCFSAER